MQKSGWFWGLVSLKVIGNIAFNIIIIIIIIKHIYRAHFRGMPQMRWRQQLHVK